jgi:hypothetical protein
MNPNSEEHNPDGLTPEQYGAPEWRLLNKGEVEENKRTRHCFYEAIQKWEHDGWNASGWTGDSLAYTYRRRVSPAPGGEKPTTESVSIGSKSVVPATPKPAMPEGWLLPCPFDDTFNGSLETLFGATEALLELDASNSLIPHGIGGHARRLLNALAARLWNAASLRQRLEAVERERDELAKSRAFYIEARDGADKHRLELMVDLSIAETALADALKREELLKQQLASLVNETK